MCVLPTSHVFVEINPLILRKYHTMPLEQDGGGSWTGPVDKDGFPVGRIPDDKKKIEALPAVDHSQIEVRFWVCAGGGRERHR